MTTTEKRAKRVSWALAMTRDTALMPSRYEQQLLDQYVQGILSLDQVIDLLDRQESRQAMLSYDFART